MRNVLAEIHNVIDELEKEGLQKEAQDMNEVFIKLAQFGIPEFLNKNVVQPVKNYFNPKPIQTIDIVLPAGVDSLTKLAPIVGSTREQLLELGNPGRLTPGMGVKVPLNDKTKTMKRL